MEDAHAMCSWHFPTNNSRREYQHGIIKEALAKNTLVVLPTGLGKTFIASVVMYNYRRWFPTLKVIFMAPTRPLVRQQLEATIGTVEISPEISTEMTGHLNPTYREQLWKEKSVFFLTPHVLQNDLAVGICDPRSISLIIFDEAHKAVSNYAYCEVVKEFTQKIDIDRIRILALTATPASTSLGVQNIIDNLYISNLCIRDETSPDVAPYVHGRSIETIIVQESPEIKHIRKIFEDGILKTYLGALNRLHAIRETEPSKISRFALIKAREAMRMRGSDNQRSGGGFLEANFASLMSLYQGYDLLNYHGVVPFRNYITNDDPSNSSGFKTRLKHELEGNENYRAILDYINEISRYPTFVSHPKIEILEGILLEHFSSNDAENTRAIVFSHYRESVYEIVSRLGRYAPRLKVMSFVGQAAATSFGKNNMGVTQRQQIEVLTCFKKGGYNILVATCIGEEGLDIGSVDLIVCFDMQASPIRMLQRIGRTGRHREGKIKLLLTAGKEERNYQQTQAQQRTVSRSIMRNNFTMYKPRSEQIPQRQLESMLCVERVFELAANKKALEDNLLNPSIKRKKAKTFLRCSISESTLANAIKPVLGRYISDQRRLSPSILVPHSKRSILICSLVPKNILDDSRPQNQSNHNDPSNQIPSDDIEVIRDTLQNAIDEMKPFTDPFSQYLPLSIYSVVFEMIYLVKDKSNSKSQNISTNGDETTDNLKTVSLNGVNVPKVYLTENELSKFEIDQDRFKKLLVKNSLETDYSLTSANEKFEEIPDELLEDLIQNSSINEIEIPKPTNIYQATEMVQDLMIKNSNYPSIEKLGINDDEVEQAIETLSPGIPDKYLIDSQFPPINHKFDDPGAKNCSNLSVPKTKTSQNYLNEEELIIAPRKRRMTNVVAQTSPLSSLQVPSPHLKRSTKRKTKNLETNSKSIFLDLQAGCSGSSEGDTDMIGTNSQATSLDGFIVDSVSESFDEHIEESIFDEKGSSQDMMSLYRRTAHQTQADPAFFTTAPRQFMVRPNFHEVPPTSSPLSKDSGPKMQPNFKNELQFDAEFNQDSAVDFINEIDWSETELGL